MTISTPPPQTPTHAQSETVVSPTSPFFFYFDKLALVAQEIERNCCTQHDVACTHAAACIKAVKITTKDFFFYLCCFYKLLRVPTSTASIARKARKEGRKKEQRMKRMEVKKKQGRRDKKGSND